MPAIYLYRCTVQPEDIDGQGHVNNLTFVRWMQDAAVAHSAAQGWPPERYRTLGCGWVVRSHWIEYRRPAFLNDLIVVETWVADFKRISSRRRYRICRDSDGVVLAVAETNWAFVDLQSFLPRRVPPPLREAFQVVDRSLEVPEPPARPDANECMMDNRGNAKEGAGDVGDGPNP